MTNDDVLTIPEEVIQKITAFTVQRGQNASNTWKEFFPLLVTTYRDGYIVSGLQDITVSIQRVFYPRWWLDQTGYWNSKFDRKGILFDSNPADVNTDVGSVNGDTFVFTMILAAIVASTGGYFLAKKHYSRDGYMYVSSQAPMELNL